MYLPLKMDNMEDFVVLGIVHYLWEGGGWQMGEERLELFVPPLMMKENFFCLPQRENKNFFDPLPPPVIA